MPWSKKTKNAEAVSTLKTKIESQGGVLRILTPDSMRILVGSSENLVLIYQEAFDDWSLKTKISA